jgi:hypothetical protein
VSPLGLVVVIVLILVLLGAAGPHFYHSAPWGPGYGFGNGGISLLGILLVVVLIFALSGYL